MHRHVTIIIIAALSLFAAPISLFAEGATVTIGGAVGWPRLSFESGLARGKGRLGYQALVLSTSKAKVADSGVRAMPQSATRADLELTFDGGSFVDKTGNYQVKANALRSIGQSRARRGTGAAICDTDGNGLALRGTDGSLFAESGESGSFSVEFWLFPAVTENGSNLFEWRSSRTGTSGSVYQFIRASMFGNKLAWTFSKLWFRTDGTPIDVSLEGRKSIIPNSWSHHELSYDADSGMLEYRLNGSVEAITFVTSTGRESGDVYPALFGTPSDIEIASRYSGIIDEFRIFRRPAPEDSLSRLHDVMDAYPSGGGRFETQPIDSGGLESSLSSVAVTESLPAGTGTAYFVRAGDNFFEWSRDEPAWIPVVPGKPIQGVTGRYFQVAGELYPDGRGSASPTVTSISLEYEKDSPPWPPSKVFATAGSLSVTVEWIASVDFDTAGYLVYYGERPGEYLAAGSPIDAGKALSCVVDGLVNGKAYYFCVAAYDASGPRHPGTLSREAFARPLANR